MSWNDFKSSVSRLAEKASRKTEDLADTAALRLRLNETRGKLDEAYAGLGRLMYTRLRDGGDNTVEIDAVLSRIDTLTQEIGNLEAKLDAKKAAKQAAKQADGDASCDQADEAQECAESESTEDGESSDSDKQ